MSKRIKPISMIAALAVAFVIAFQAFTIHKMNAVAPNQPLPWKVFYDGGYWDSCREDQPGEEISLNRSFPWGEEMWHIPAIYSCKEGLVVEFCADKILDAICLKKK